MLNQNECCAYNFFFFTDDRKVKYYIIIGASPSPTLNTVYVISDNNVNVCGIIL